MGFFIGKEMAGDWIKLQKDTFDKPEVLAIATRMGIDPDAVVGKLCRIWAWFDTHTVNGNASCVTFSFIDRYVGVTGFAEQVSLVGWLAQEGYNLYLPNFEYHNGETAKTRALGKNRAEKARSNARSNATRVTKTLPEKRREEKSINTPSDDGFDMFYQAYPKKVGKPAATKAWKAAKVKVDEVSAILGDIATRSQSRDWIKDDGQFIPNPATYLNQRRWEDQPQQPHGNPFAGAI